MIRRHAGIVVAVLLALLEFALRSQVLLERAALYQRDLFLLYFPLVQAALRAVSEGAMPLRDPTSAFGQPLLADPSCQILYPPVLIHFLLPPHLAYAWFVSLHSVFGAMGIALLVRRLTAGSWVAGFAGGSFWILCGPLQSLATLWHHMSGAAWIPWVLLAADRLAASEKQGVLRLAAAFGCQILAGSADMCAMSALLCIAFVPPRSLFGRLRGWLAAGLAAVLLSSGVWMPALQLAVESGRAALAESERTYWSVHPLVSLEFFFPIPWSALPLPAEWSKVIFEGREPFLGSMFLGTLLLPLILAAVADDEIPASRRAGFIVAATCGVLVSFGKFTPVYSWFVTMLPPLRILRFPSKVMVPVAVLLCVVAGVGVRSILRSSSARRMAAVGIAVSGAVTLALLGPALPAFMNTFVDDASTQAPVVWANLPKDLALSSALLCLLGVLCRRPSSKVAPIIGALLWIGHVYESTQVLSGLNPVVDVSVLRYRPPHLEMVRPKDGGRLYVYDYRLFQGRFEKYLDPRAFDVRGLDGLDSGAQSVLATRAYLSPLVGSFWNLEYAWDANLRQLFHRRLAGLTLDLRRVEETPGLLKLLQVSGVSRVVALHERGLGDLRPIARIPIFYSEDLRLFEVPDARPRAFLVSGRKAGSDSDLSDLLDPSFDPGRVVITDAKAERPASPTFSGDARVVERRADRTVVETHSNEPGFLVLLEGAMPGWSARVDAEATPVERANAIFIGVEVPAGSHRVEFRFRPTVALVGILLTMATALALIARALKDRATASATES